LIIEIDNSLSFYLYVGDYANLLCSLTIFFLFLCVY
jgi:hypothetical protein